MNKRCFQRVARKSSRQSPRTDFRGSFRLLGRLREQSLSFRADVYFPLRAACRLRDRLNHSICSENSFEKPVEFSKGVSQQQPIRSDARKTSKSFTQNVYIVRPETDQAIQWRNLRIHQTSVFTWKMLASLPGRLDLVSHEVLHLRSHQHERFSVE